jgi:uncharacterized protein
VKKILLLSDTHSCEDTDIVQHFDSVDEIWHAGDWGNTFLFDKMEKSKKTIRGVYGNIDDQKIRSIFPESIEFECEGVQVAMTHIAGYPGKFNSKILSYLRNNPPDLFICGHSHILRVMRDKSLNGMLFMNPGAAGRHGFHHMRTMLRFDLNNSKIENVIVIELGKRTAGILPEL